MSGSTGFPVLCRVSGRACLIALSLGFLQPKLGYSAPREEIAENSYIVKPTKLWTVPNKFGEPIAVLEPGLRVEVLLYGTSGEWIQLRTPSGREGWVPVRFTALSGRRDADILIGNQRASTNERKPGSMTDPETLAQNPGAAGPAEITSTVTAEVVPANDLTPEGVAAANAKMALPVEEADVSDIKQAKARAKTAPRAAMIRVRPETIANGLQASAALEYAQQVSPESLPGVALRPDLFWSIDSNFSVGGGLDYAYFGKTFVNNEATTQAQLAKNLHRFFPHAAARYAIDKVRVDFALGADFQHTSLRTTRIGTGAVILTNPAGELVTGSEWSTALGLRLTPTYFIVDNERFSFGISVTYALRWEFGSGTGKFAGTPTSGLQHTIGAGVALLTEF